MMPSGTLMPLEMALMDTVMQRFPPALSPARQTRSAVVPMRESGQWQWFQVYPNMYYVHNPSLPPVDSLWFTVICRHALLTQQMTVVQCPAVGIETFLQSSGIRCFGWQRVVDRQNGDTQLLWPVPKIILINKEIKAKKRNSRTANRLFLLY